MLREKVSRFPITLKAVVSAFGYSHDVKSGSSYTLLESKHKKYIYLVYKSVKGHSNICTVKWA